jgi:hypothetical protein
MVRSLPVIRRTLPCLLALAAALPTPGSAATVIDWHLPDPADRFQLLRDNGQSAATLEILPAIGTLPPVFPLAGSFADDFWLTPPDWQDSLSSDRTLGTFDVLVQPPPTGGFRYTLILQSTSPAGFGQALFAFGGVFPFAGPTIEIQAFNASSTPVPLNTTLVLHGWDAGFSAYDGPVHWNAGTQTATFPGSPDLESAFAFFELPSSGVTRLELVVDSPFFPAPGEMISFALGTIIPEPTMPLLAAAGLLTFGLRRTRPQTPGSA